ncbi:unnamed protein product [Heligmosomoides polygyrus]|uniref:GPS domain-containing protein n=1 Tax=Heligmosomoides polygyrus TaxID=6339 RepID=A0A183GAR2_HELPZ|nr:unnamed protein product [Heligmosomoides polygyrus]
MGEDTMATVQCDEQYFAVPCNRHGTTSTLLLRFTTARVRQTCEVSCGLTPTTFELTGILKWTRTIHGSALRVINGESSLYDEIVFPDFFHIVDVMLSWYKTILIAVVCIIVALLLGYTILWTWGLHFLSTTLRTICTIPVRLASAVIRIAKETLSATRHRSRRRQSQKKKL